MREPRAYVFDLYGTLLDIWTDEEDPALWEKLAGFYSVYGADWQPEELKGRYHSLIRMEERRISLATGYHWPEVDLSDVFWTLFREAPRHHLSSNRVTSRNSRTWSAAAAHFFRISSRRRFGLYPHTLPVLKALRERGTRLLLLSNAQAVFTRPELEITGLVTQFDRIVLSSDEGLRKPEPELLRSLLKEEKLAPEEAVLVGNDFASDMEIAAACGVPGVFLNTEGTPSWFLRKRAERFGDKVSLIESGDLEDLLRLFYGKGLSADMEKTVPETAEEAEEPSAVEEISDAKGALPNKEPEQKTEAELLP